MLRSLQRHTSVEAHRVTVPKVANFNIHISVGQPHHGVGYMHAHYVPNGSKASTVLEDEDAPRFLAQPPYIIQYAAMHARRKVHDVKALTKQLVLSIDTYDPSGRKSDLSIVHTRLAKMWRLQVPTTSTSGTDHAKTQLLSYSIGGAMAAS